MRRPFLVPLSIAIALIVLMLGFEAASFSAPPWSMMGPYMMSGAGPWNGYGPPAMHGYGSFRGSSGDLNLSTDAVKSQLERWIAWQGNARLKVGDVKEKDADSIVADIVTKDNSLVQRLAVNRHTGFVQDIQD